MTLQQAQERQIAISVSLSALSGSRRRNGNTKFLIEKAIQAAASFFDEIQTQIISTKLPLRIDFTPFVFETHFDDHEEIVENVKSSDGLLLGSPVYFGSISPSLNQVLRDISARNDILLTSKVADSLAVGTQRNGGQETAIEDFWRWYLDRNITFLGNGPVTTQYGGTAWGGSRMSAQRDIYGISTSMGAGKRLVQDVLIRSVGKKFLSMLIDYRSSPELFSECSASSLSGKEFESEIIDLVPKSAFLFFSDSSKKNSSVRHMVRGISSGFEELTKICDVPEITGKNPKIDYLSLEADMQNVKDCAACAICPPGNQKLSGVYGCIYDDDVNHNFYRFYRASAIVCSTRDKYGLTTPEFWIALNRMRSVRRNNYMFTGRMGSVAFQPTSGSNIPLKWLVRNNLSLLSSSRNNCFELGRLLFRETFLRDFGMRILNHFGVNVWTPPVHHE
jgi:multimeric flavodoxin WrbA